MKIAFFAAGLCAGAAAVALAGQNRGLAPNGPRSQLVSALDADRQGVISSDEIRASSTALRTLDTNHDGRVTIEELRPAGGRGGPQGERREGSAGAPDDLANTLMAFDRNSDGRLEPGEVPQRFQGVFSRADANKDGALTREELSQAAGASRPSQEDRGPRGGREGRFGRGRGGAMDPLLRALDANRDGALDEAEIVNAPRALATLDANHDGQLSADEFRPARPAGFGGRERRRL